MSRDAVLSWGRYPRQSHHVERLWDRHRPLPNFERFVLPFGNGRSYGDVCLNDAGVLLATRRMDRYMDFDPIGGSLTCESGVLLKEILDLIVPQGWFLPITPGTKYVTVGGAVANDVHGKNHHRLGSFGHCVRRLELLRSDGSRIVCSSQQNQEWFRSTVGGLGLTGLITWVEISLRPVANAYMVGDTQRFFSLAEFFALSSQSERDYEYTVAWIDCADVYGRGRGLLMRANHAPADERRGASSSRRVLRVPFTPPIAIVNRLTLPLFNRAYFWKARTDAGHSQIHYDLFFYPLDAILEWNRLYGPKGFLQYQCIVPPDSAELAVGELLRLIAKHKAGSFLAVLKMFGTTSSIGMMSFPRPGTTLALDFPLHGIQTFALLNNLDRVVIEAGGAVYPAKDARMGREIFRSGFPAAEAFAEFIDPKFSSSFWRRVAQ